MRITTRRASEVSTNAVTGGSAIRITTLTSSRSDTIMTLHSYRKPELVFNEQSSMCSTIRETTCQTLMTDCLNRLAVMLVKHAAVMRITEPPATEVV
jgi:hypothetical protein